MTRATYGRRPRPPGALLCVLLTLACSSESPQSKRGAGPGGPVPVTAAVAARRDVPVTVQAIGTVEASHTVNVRPRVGGELTRVAFVEGDDVRQGELLFTLDSRPYEAALQAAQADSARGAAQYEAARAQETRYVELIEKDYVTRQDYEEVKADAAALKATLQADAAQVRTARLNLGYCTIRAPIPGRTGALSVRAGNQVGASDPDPLVDIQQLTPIHVSFTMPEQHLARIRRHAGEGTLRVRVAARGDSGEIQEGPLTFIDNAVDPNTGTVRLKATFPNADRSLWPGQFVDVTLVLTVVKDAVVVPAAAVQKGQRGDFVYLIKPDRTAAMQPVTVAFSTGNEVVLSQGIQPDDQVVVDGQLKLFPGAKVEITAAAGAAVPAGRDGGARAPADSGGTVVPVVRAPGR